jgi:hypothetical protein
VEVEVEVEEAGDMQSLGTAGDAVECQDFPPLSSLG